MRVVLYAIKGCLDYEVVNPVCFLSIELEDEIPVYQITQLLDVLQNKYKCIKYKAEPVYKNEEDAAQEIYDLGIDEQIEDEVDFQNELRRLLTQRRYYVTPLGNFNKVFKELTTEVEAIFKLHIEMIGADVPVLYVNDIPIRKFHNSSYPYKIIKFALGLPNGSVVLVGEVLGNNRRDRGCSQDLCDIFRQSALRAVFAREIKKDSFKIYHHVTSDNLKNNKNLQQIMAKEGALSDTTFLSKKVEDSRISI